MKMIFVLLGSLVLAAAFKRVDHEVTIRTPRGMPVDKLIFSCGKIFAVPVTDGHPDSVGPNSTIMVFDDTTWDHEQTLTIKGVTTANCGFRINEVTGDWLIIDTMTSEVYNITDNPCDARDGDELDADLFSWELGQVANDMDFDQWGNLYITDTIGGDLFFIDVNGGAPEKFVEMTGDDHPWSPMRPNMLTTNGIVYDNAMDLFYIGHFGRGTISRLHVRDGNGRLEIDDSEFEGGIEEWKCCFNGIDGLALDEENGYLFATQMDYWGSPVFDTSTGVIVMSYGEFNGVQKYEDPVTGKTLLEADGQLSPSSAYFKDGYLYVTNLLLKWDEFPGLFPTGLDEWMALMDVHNVLRWKVDTDDFLNYDQWKCYGERLHGNPSPGCRPPTRGSPSSDSSN